MPPSRLPTRIAPAAAATASSAPYKCVLQWKQLIPLFSMYAGLLPSCVATSRSEIPMCAATSRARVSCTLGREAERPVLGVCRGVWMGLGGWVGGGGM